MSELPLNIDLKFERKFFEEIYFKNGNGNIFFGRETKNYSIALIILILTLFITKTNRDLSSANWGFFYFLSFITFLICVVFAIKIFTILKWKKSIKVYLDNLERFKIFKLTLNDKNINLKMDDNETQEKWSEIKKYEFEDDFISIKGQIDYFFPKRSMTNDEFEALKEIIKTKTNE